MPNRTTPGDDSFFSRLMDRWQREHRTISKSETAGFGEEAEGGEEDCDWTWTEELMVSCCCWCNKERRSSDCTEQKESKTRIAVRERERERERERAVKERDREDTKQTRLNRVKTRY